MLIKFEAKSARVKGLAFHPRRRWVLASLHSGVIQLWDYSEKVMIDKYDEHKGPVRGLDFHKQQPLFVSGGDDTLIRVWNYKARRCLFTLKAHDDYIRSTFFHNNYPWILSSSDDQTVRIWNWQSRTRIVVLTGHTHYVMCAQFHPKLDLIVSASVDQTLRIWDISALKTKSARTGSDESGLGMPEILIKTDYNVKVIEAHSSEINWACFHPERNFMLSAGDDNYIKIWRIDPYREIDTCRGHYNNVSCAIFHPRKNLVISASEDKSIKVWDFDKRSALITHRREIERFWILAAHPKENLFAAGHDGGMMLFKLERERPPFVVHGDKILYIHGNQLFKYRMKTEGKPGQSKLVITLKTKPEITHHYHRIDYRDDHVLVTIRSSNIEKSIYDIYKISERSNYDRVQESSRSQGLNAIFIGKDKIAVLDKSKKVIFKNLLNQERTLNITITAEEIYNAGVAKLFVRDNEELFLWDLSKAAAINSVKVKVKFVVVSENKRYIACIGSNKITICDQDLTVLSVVQEQRKIKSAAWEEGGVLIYTTPTHIKYALTDGEITTIKSVDTTLYLMAIKESCIFCIDRNGDIRRISINPVEYRFKQAVVNRDYPSMVTYIRKMKNLKQSDINFLVQKNYPELAMNFVKDHKIRFSLALQAFRIEDALESAKVIKDNKCWEQLAETAMSVGHIKSAEIAYTQLRKPYKLAMLYLVTSMRDKMIQARKLAREDNDKSTDFIISLLMKDFEGCAKAMLESGQTNLAYACAMNHGLAGLAEQIKSQLTPEQQERLPAIRLKGDSSWMKLSIPDMKNQQSNNWPLLVTPERLDFSDLQQMDDEEEEEKKSDVRIEEKEEEEPEENIISDHEEEVVKVEEIKPLSFEDDDWDDQVLEDLSDEEDNNKKE